MEWEEVKIVLREASLSPKLGLVTDVDGTISPIVDDPDVAHVTQRNLENLARLADLLPLVAVISGRSAEDVARRVGLPGLVYIGNHGMEQWLDGEVRVLPSAAAYRGALQEAMQQVRETKLTGMHLEDKGATLSIHYRRTRNPDQVGLELAPVLQAIAKTHDLRLTQGRRVFELRPPIAVDKGTAFEELVRSHHLKAAFYLGDDKTDVAVFQAAGRMRKTGSCLAFGLGVVSPGTPEEVLTQADVLIQEVAGVESFLAWLLKARMASST